MSVTINDQKNKKKFANLSFENIKSILNFTSWLQKNLPSYLNKEIPKEHLLIYISYIREQVELEPSVNSMEWKKALVDLENNLGD